MSAASASNFRLGPPAARWHLRALWLALVLLAVSVIGGIFRPTEFFSSYLFAYLFWLGLTLGSLALLMTYYLTGGAWGVVARRTLEAATRTLPLLALLFVPVIAGIAWLYPWSHASVVQADEALRHRSAYMNAAMYEVRAIVYFAIWGTLTYLLNRWSREEDAGAVRRPLMERLSAPGLILYVFTVTFASVDWAESLTSHWASTMWGFLFVIGQALAAMGFVIVALALLSARAPMSQYLRASHFHDLGKLLLMFVMLWAYFAFSQLLIVWSGNLTYEIPWYLPRFATSWAGIGLALIVLQFAIPFLLLLSRPLKRSPRALSVAVGIVLIMRFIDLYWIVMPAFHERGVQFSWLNLSLPVALGGLWIAVFLVQLQKLPLLPPNTRDLEKALQHGKA
jgi:hypothetical protein